MILQSVDLSGGGITAGQQLFAVTIVATFFIVLGILRYRYQFAGLERDQQVRNKRTLQGQMQVKDPRTLRVTDAKNLRERIDLLFDREEADAFEEPPTTAHALGQVRRGLELSYRDATSNIPRLALTMLYEGVFVLLLGAIALVPAATWQETFSGGGGVTFGWLLDRAASITTDVVQLPGDALGAFPYADAVYALLLTGVIKGGQAVYEHWYVTGTLLVLGAIAVALLARRVPDSVETTVYDSHLLAGIAAVLATAIVWVGGVVPATLGRLAGFPQVGAVIGFLVAFGLFAWIGYEVLRGLWRRLHRLGEAGGLDRWAVAYVGARRVSSALVVVLVPVVLAYAAVAVMGGKFIAVASAFASGSVTAKVLVGGVLLLIVVGVILQTREEWPTVRAALTESLARKAVRAALFGRAAPLFILVFGYFLAVGVGMNALLAAAAAVVAAVGARLLYLAFERVRYHASLFESRDRGASRVVLQGYRLEDTDDEDLYYGRANTHAVAHTDREAAVDALVDATEELLESGEAEASIASAVAEDALEYGIVDVEETVRKLVQTVDEELNYQLEKADGQIDAETLEEKLGDYPEPVWDRVTERRSNVLRRDGFYVRI